MMRTRQWYSILDQLMLSATQPGQGSQDCLIWSDPDVVLVTDQQAATPQQAAWYLLTGDWVPDLFTSCDTEDCLNTAHLSTWSTRTQEDPDPDVVLVNRTLASLYRQARSKGLVNPTSAYGN